MLIALICLGFAPWQYGLAFAAPCIGGLIGSRLACRLAARFGQDSVLFIAGTLRACWILGLAFVRPGVAGIDQQQHDDRGVHRAVGVLASLTGPRTAIAIAGVLILATPLLLPRPRQRRSRPVSEPAVLPNPLA